MWAPFLMCLVLTGIHAYLGIHVIAREVVFVDIALAQIAALGAAAAFLVGFEPDDPGSYWFGLAATILGALVLALTRSRKRHVSQEAVIGVVYAVSSAAAVLLADRSPHGAEHLRTMLVGSILAVRWPDVVRVAALYAAVGLFHWLCRRPFFLISFDPGRRLPRGLAGPLVGLSLLRLVRRGCGQLRPRRRRSSGLLVPHRPALAGIAVGGTVLDSPPGWVGLWHRREPGRACSPRPCLTYPPGPRSRACSGSFCSCGMRPCVCCRTGGFRCELPRYRRGFDCDASNRLKGAPASQTAGQAPGSWTGHSAMKWNSSLVVVDPRQQQEPDEQV